MGWIKKPRPGPIDLGTAHLDTITEPNEYTQVYQGRATRARGYPWEGVAGFLVILPWNTSSGNVIAVFTAWHGGIAKRTYYMGAWRPWLDATGKAVE